MPDLPFAVRSRLEYHIGLITRTNEAIDRCRQTDRLAGASGRYEWEYRTTQYPDLEPSVAFFATFEERARAHGIDPEAIYAAYGGKPEPVPWSVEALAWVHPGV